MRFFRTFSKKADPKRVPYYAPQNGGEATLTGVFVFFLGGCACCHCEGQGKRKTFKKSKEQPESTESKEPARVNNAGARVLRQSLFLDVGGVPRFSFFLAWGRVFQDRTSSWMGAVCEMQLCLGQGGVCS